jgi:hypothetical protein
VKPQFGDLPLDAQEMLTKHLHVDFTRCDFKAPRWFSAWARNDLGHITGIFTTEFQHWFEGKVTIMVLDPRCMSRRTLRAIFTALFSRARRLTAEVEPDNRRALRQVQRLGWVYEGYRRLGLEGTRDTMMFGMLKNECRYLPSYVPPSVPPFDVANRHLMDTVVRSDGGLRASVGADRENLGFGELGISPGFTSPGSPFDEVGASGSPAEMVAVDAVPYPASVRGVHSTRGRAVRGDADDAVDFSIGTAVPHLSVASRVGGKRPKQTFVSGIGNGVSEKNFRGHLPSSSVKG